MTRVYELELEEFDRIKEGIQSFIVLKNDKIGIKSGDNLILQHIPEEGGAMEVMMLVDFFLIEGLKTGYVICQLKDPNA